MACKVIRLILLAVCCAKHAMADGKGVAQLGKSMSKAFVPTGQMPRLSSSVPVNPEIVEVVTGSLYPPHETFPSNQFGSTLRVKQTVKEPDHELKEGYHHLRARMQKMPQADAKYAQHAFGFGSLIGLMAWIGLVASIGIAAARKCFAREEQALQSTLGSHVFQSPQRSRPIAVAAAAGEQADLEDQTKAGPTRNDEYDEFEGRIIVVDLSCGIGLETWDFEGRDWLEWRTREALPVGWDVEWEPDRFKGANSPIALMQFSDESTCLLVRTKRSRSWLPKAIIDCLQSEDCKKIGVGWDGSDKTKMELSFNMQPNGIVDLAKIAYQKGLEERGLVRLCKYFGLEPLKDKRIARSNWARKGPLSAAQIRYAAEDAYFQYLLYDKLLALPDLTPEELEKLEKLRAEKLEKRLLSALANVTMKPEWEAEYIEKRADGLWCGVCNKGPMMPEAIDSHISGARHRKKVQLRQQGLSAEGILTMMTPEWEAEYIEQRADGLWCCVCNKGPMNMPDVIDIHISSARHRKNVQLRQQGLSAEGILTMMKPELGAENIEPRADACKGPTSGLSVSASPSSSSLSLPKLQEEYQQRFKTSPHWRPEEADSTDPQLFRVSLEHQGSVITGEWSLGKKAAKAAALKVCLERIGDSLGNYGETVSDDAEDEGDDMEMQNSSSDGDDSINGSKWPDEKILIWIQATLRLLDALPSSEESQACLHRRWMEAKQHIPSDKVSRIQGMFETRFGTDLSE